MTQRKHKAAAKVRKKREPREMKLRVFMSYKDAQGNEVEYDATDKDESGYPEELKAALDAKRREVHQKIIVPAFWRWLELRGEAIIRRRRKNSISFY